MNSEKLLDNAVETKSSFFGDNQEPQAPHNHFDLLKAVPPEVNVGGGSNDQPDLANEIKNLKAEFQLLKKETGELKQLRSDHEELKNYTLQLENQVTPQAVKLMVKVGLHKDSAEMMWTMVKWIQFEVVFFVAFLEYTQKNDWAAKIIDSYHSLFITIAVVTVPLALCCGCCLLCCCALKQPANKAKALALVSVILRVFHIFTVGVSYLGIAGYASRCNRTIVISAEITTVVMVSLAIVHWFLLGKWCKWKTEKKVNSSGEEEMPELYLTICKFMVSAVMGAIFLKIKGVERGNVAFPICLIVVGYCLLLWFLCLASFDVADGNSQTPKIKVLTDFEKSFKKLKNYLLLHYVFICIAVTFGASLHAANKNEQ